MPSPSSHLPIPACRPAGSRSSTAAPSSCTAKPKRSGPTFPAGCATGPRPGADLPAVGDWVAFGRHAQGERATIEAVLPRRTAFVRKAAGFETVEQVVAANVDVVFVVTSLVDDLNPRRLERYLALAWESGAEPVVVLTKADLCEEHRGGRRALGGVTFGVPAHIVSAVTGEGIDELIAHLAGGRTATLVGSSGVGKSTLVNRLCGSRAAGDRRASARRPRPSHDHAPRAGRARRAAAA